MGAEHVGVLLSQLVRHETAGALAWPRGWENVVRWAEPIGPSLRPVMVFQKNWNGPTMGSKKDNGPWAQQQK